MRRRAKTLICLWLSYVVFLSSVICRHDNDPSCCGTMAILRACMYTLNDVCFSLGGRWGQAVTVVRNSVLHVKANIGWLSVMYLNPGSGPFCVCVRACVRACVCVCVLERERERERERNKGKYYGKLCELHIL